MIIELLLILVGFVALILGANWLVNGASALAKKYNVSDLAIGLTIVALGTSAPELIVNIIASIKGSSDIALGNVIGSNNLNLFFILGLCGLIIPLNICSSTAKKEIPFSILATLLLFLFLNYVSFNGEKSLCRFEGFILLVFFGIFLFHVFKESKTEIQTNVLYQTKSTLVIWGLITIGIIGLIVGGKLVVDHSIIIAHKLGVSEKIIGLTIVAIGTSLPELVTSVVATMKKNIDIAVGNIVGSNIFNILAILSVSSLITPINVIKSFNFDILFLIFGTLFLYLTLRMGKSNRLERWEAAILFVAYIIYMIYLIIQEIYI